VLALFAKYVTLIGTQKTRSFDMPTRSIDLTVDDDQFVNELVDSGQFANANEVIQAGLRLLEGQAREENEKLHVLRSLASEAFHELDQGQGIVIDGEQPLTEFIGQVGRRAAEEVEHHTAGG
jgi:antitoxin ParD1/3/4